MKRIKVACEQYGSPIPEIVNEAGGVSVKCKASENYLKALKGNFINSEKISNEQIQLLTDRQKEIIRLIEENNAITQKEMAKKLNITRQTITVEIKSLKNMSIISREGSTKNGIWKIL